MTDDMLLAQLPGWAFAFVLVLCRCGGAVMLLPGFAEAEVPPMVRAGLALAVTLLLLPTVVPLLPQPPDPAHPEAAKLAALLATETFIGVLLGFLARLLVLALPIAGQVMSYMLGLANVLQPDPLLGGQATPVARLLGLAGPVLFLSGGLYAGPLSALAGSYSLFAAGAAPLFADSTSSVVAAVSACFLLALRLAAPFLLAGTVWQVALALLARLVPQLQIQALAMPGQILGGLALLGLSAAALLSTWQGAVQAGLAGLPGY
jgi:flagellar biosynthetic protein FliR